MMKGDGCRLKSESKSQLVSLQSVVPASTTLLKQSSLPPVIKVPATSTSTTITTTIVTPSIRSCMNTSTAANTFDVRGKLDHGKKTVTPIISSELSPMGLHLPRKSLSNPSSPNFLQQQPKTFEFCHRVIGGQRPTTASHFGRGQTGVKWTVTGRSSLSQPAGLNLSSCISRSLSPPRSITVETTRSHSSFNVTNELLRPPPPPLLLPTSFKQSYSNLVPTGRTHNGRKKQFSMPRKSSSPTSRFFPVLAATSECHQEETGHSPVRNLSERWRIKGEPGFQALRGARIRTKMNFSKGRDEASSSTRVKNSDECYKMIELRRNILEASECDDEREGSVVDSENSMNGGSRRRISADERSTSTSRARMSLLGKSFSIDTNSDNPIPCQDFGIRDYLTMTGESIDNEEESSLAGDFGTGLGVIPPRFSIDSIDSQMAILQELKESRSSFSSSTSTSAAPPIKETFRRRSEDVGLSSAAQRRNQAYTSSVPIDVDARNHGELNINHVEDISKPFSEGRPQLHKSVSTPHPSNVINRSPLPKIQEDRYHTLLEPSQVLLKDSCECLHVDPDRERRISGDALMRTWKIKGTLEELEDDDNCWQCDDDEDNNDDELSTSIKQNGNE